MLGACLVSHLIATIFSWDSTHDVWGVNVLWWLLCRLGSRVCTLQFHVSPCGFHGTSFGLEELRG
jgi:hypothetical protein